MFCRRWPKVSVFKHWHMQTNTRMDFKLKILCSPTLITLSSLTPVTMDPPKHEPWIWTSHHNYLYSGSLSASTSTQHCHILCPRWHQSPRGAVTHPHHQHGECWMLARHFSDLTSDGISEDLNAKRHIENKQINEIILDIYSRAGTELSSVSHSVIITQISSSACRKGK